MISRHCSAFFRRPRALHCFPTVSLSAPLLFHTVIFICFCCPMLFTPPATNFGRTVCAFSSLDDSNECQRGELEENGGELLNGWFCDPSSTMSMSEVFAIDETLRRIYEQNRHNCVCGRHRQEENIQKLQIDDTSKQISSSDICWFRFGFAVVPELSPGPDSASAENCADNYFEIGTTTTNNNTLTSVASAEEEEEEHGDEAEQQQQRQQFNTFLPPEKGNNLFDTFSAFGANYARVLREQWQIGECGEDILILVVQRAPQKLLNIGPQSSALSRPIVGPFPLLFLSFGSLITHRLHPDFGHALQHIVLEANSQLQRDGRPLFKVISELLLRMDVEVLEGLAAEFFGASDGAGTAPHRFPPATHARHRHSSYAEVPMPRSHIPPWAWAVFGACGVAFALMALGLFLIRSRTRRSGAAALGGGFKKQLHHQHTANSSMMACGSSRRHWKESSQFGRDEQQPSTTYVNLVQLLMPHPKPTPANMPQQV